VGGLRGGGWGGGGVLSIALVVVLLTTYSSNPHTKTQAQRKAAAAANIWPLSLALSLYERRLRHNPGADPFVLLEAALEDAGAQLPAAAAHNLEQARQAIDAHNATLQAERGPLVLAVGNCCHWNLAQQRLETYGAAFQQSSSAASHGVMQVGVFGVAGWGGWVGLSKVLF